MATSTIKLITGFSDESKRELEIGPLSPTSAAVTNAKANIAQVNNNISNIADIYISEGGASCVGIIGAQIITTNETEINLNE